MLCKNPYMRGILAHGCGQCLPCRISQRRLWTHRMMLESLEHEHSSFITLTYSDDHIPESGSLDPKHVQDWLKAIRRRVEPTRLRYFLVGEYGDETFRPHYHVALFGYEPCKYLRSRYKYNKDCCFQCDLVRDTWGKGNIDVGVLEKDSAQYVAGYTTKKMTSKDDPRLCGRFPEFARMSLKPGIGASFMDVVADAYQAQLMSVSSESTIRLPSILNHGSKQWPLGRYLKGKLNALLELTSSREVTDIGGRLFKTRLDSVGDLLKDEFFLSMFQLQETARSSEGGSPKEVFKKVTKEKIRNVEARERIFKKVKVI
uniref:Putative replication protein VP4 n=1 Tax=uncultured virus TaxID=340016 RepID=A0A1D8MK78_9VIRU|nr:putative replication protein VP4 [uncultured virus]